MSFPPDKINPSFDLYEKLLLEVLERHIQPENEWEIAAILESFGWTDKRVEQELGLHDVFQLARILWPMTHRNIATAANSYRQQTSYVKRWISVIKRFIRGTFFALPMLIGIASMLFFRFSLWSYEQASVKTATAIAIGTVLSFLTAGGFMQTISRRGFFYLLQGYYRMAGIISLRIVRASLFFSLAVSVALALFNVLFPILPWHMFVITISFYMALNAIWMAVTSLYLLQQELVFSGLLILGIGFVYIGFHYFRLNILISQLLAIVAISIIGALLVTYFFRRAVARGERGINPSLPKTTVTVYSVAPYFLYGFLYYLLLFMDRLMAWTATGQSLLPLAIWFRGDYEVALDFALIMLVVPMGLMEVSVYRLIVEAIESQQQYTLSMAGELSNIIRRKYLRSLLLMLGVSLISACTDYVVFRFVLAEYIVHSLHEPIFTGYTIKVFLFALIGYTLLSIALMNAILMFSLSRPDGVIRPLLWSIALDALIGFLFSRWFGYPDAVFGLMAGALLFSTLTTINVFRILTNVDYHLYLLS